MSLYIYFYRQDRKLRAALNKSLVTIFIITFFQGIVGEKELLKSSIQITNKLLSK